MKNNNTTELIFIIDISGSMQGLERDTIGGLNSMIEKQKTLKNRKPYLHNKTYAKWLYDYDVTFS